MGRFWSGFVAGGAAMFAALHTLNRVLESAQLHRDYDDAVNGIFGAIPESQRTDLRTQAEIARDPAPRFWRM